MQDNKDKVAFFDFCETLANFQTADRYVDYVRHRAGTRRMQRFETLYKFMDRSRILPLCERLTGRYYSLSKRLKLYQLKGVSEIDLIQYGADYYAEEVKPNLIERMITEVKTLQNLGYRVGLVSGGYDIYLRCFVEEYNLNFLLSSHISMKNGRCTGRIAGKDCLNKNKLDYLNMAFPNKPQYTVAYSDSYSDMPLLLYSDEGVVVSRSTHQKWSENNNLKEIIWEERN